MNELILSKDLEMTSLEVVDLINKFRAEEGKQTELKHFNFMQKIRKEIKSLESAGYKVNRLNFQLVKYKDNKGEYRDCYKLSRDAIFQMAASESAIVRAKLIEYINALENRILNQQHLLEIQIQREQIIAKDLQIQRLEKLVGLRTKDKFSYGKIIKDHLGIKKANTDYLIVKEMFFYELSVEKWEDIPYNRENLKLLHEILEDYKPSIQISFI